jgi:hypothetical protein
MTCSGAAPDRVADRFQSRWSPQIMRQTIGLSALTDATPQTQVKLLAPLFERLIAEARS